MHEELPCNVGETRKPLWHVLLSRSIFGDNIFRHINEYMCPPKHQKRGRIFMALNYSLYTIVDICRSLVVSLFAMQNLALNNEFIFWQSC